MTPVIAGIGFARMGGEGSVAMMNVRDHSGARRGRFRVLLTEDRPYADEHWTSQLPRLLEPQGVVSYVVRSGREALALAGKMELHAAVVDLATPMEPDGSGRQAVGTSGGADQWLLEMLRRLPYQLALVLVHNADYSQRKLDRILQEALRVGAFTVLSKPVQLEAVLAVFQRLLERRYRGAWPDEDLDL